MGNEPLKKEKKAEKKRQGDQVLKMSLKRHLIVLHLNLWSLNCDKTLSFYSISALTYWKNVDWPNSQKPHSDVTPWSAWDHIYTTHLQAYLLLVKYWKEDCPEICLKSGWNWSWSLIKHYICASDPWRHPAAWTIRWNVCQSKRKVRREKLHKNFSKSFWQLDKRNTISVTDTHFFSAVVESKGDANLQAY